MFKEIKHQIKAAMSDSCSRFSNNQYEECYHELVGQVSLLWREIKRDQDKTMLNIYAYCIAAYAVIFLTLIGKDGPEIFGKIEAELRDAMWRFHTFTSLHEGYAVLLEEVEELGDEIMECYDGAVKQNQNLETEAIQVAAMAIRFLLDLVYKCDMEGKKCST